MTNHPNRKRHAAIRAHLKDLTDVERVRYRRDDDAWICYGRMPNIIETGWWFAGYSDEIERNIAAERG
jgi:hypothetical protein